MKIFGILNRTEDSFSDGGKYISLQSATEKALELFHDGAHVIDIGAQSSNPDAKKISSDEEWSRIQPLIPILKQKKIPISIDTYRKEVIEKSILANVDYINCINSFKEEESLEILSTHSKNLPELILMFSHNEAEVAEKQSYLKTETVISTILKYFDNKINQFLKKNIPLEKLIFDPGMGFFLGEDANLSLKVLKEIDYIQRKLQRVLVSVSRKSFIGNVLGGLPPSGRAAGTLALELYLYDLGIFALRTHEPKQITQGIILRNRMKEI
ncbi:MAG: dihydropteroate synthase [Leptospiraceae bacterium]|nr:dihydropteroate synthase [Leptospiraceae bacterium]